MSLLDLAIANFGTPRIVSENHDAGRINWVNGMSDPGEMLACGYLPEARRQAGEQDAEYAQRIESIISALPIDEQIKIRASGIKAATRRADIDMTNGRAAVMVAGKAPWHQLGVNVAEAVSSADAMRLAGMGWTVGKSAMAYRGADGSWVEASDTFALSRSDTGAKLGTVGARYQPIQNADGFKFLDGVLDQFGARYESCGSLRGGKQVWMLVHLPQQSFTIGHSDRVESYALFTNPHDGSGCAYCYPTSERVVCANTLRVAQAGKGKGIAIRHTGDVMGKMADAKQALGIAVKGFDKFSSEAEILATTPMPVSVRHYADNILDAVLDVTAAEALKGVDVLAAALKMSDADAKSLEKKLEKRGSILDDILERYDSGRCGLNGQRGTLWSGLNAVTESADHGKLGGHFKGDTHTRQSARMESVISGRADEVKQVAYASALALAH